MSLAYEPSRSLPAKISRRVTPFLARRVRRFDLERPLVSFTFDDCPVSAIDNGVKPLEGFGWKSTLYVSCGLLGKTNHHGEQICETDILNLHEAGHEIGGHTFTHIDAQSVSEEAFLADIDRNQAKLIELGLPASRTFAYPYGQTLPGLKRKLEERFTGLRGIQPGVHRSEVDLNQIKSVPLFSGHSIETAKRIIAGLAQSPAWVTFFTHDVRTDHSAWGCSPAELTAIITAVKAIDADVKPVCEAIEFLEDQHA